MLHKVGGKPPLTCGNAIGATLTARMGRGYTWPPMAGRPDRGDPWRGIGTAWAVMGTLLAGIVVWGGIGYVVDRLIGFHWLFLPVGMLIGVSTSIYLVYVRYGRDHGET